MGPTPTKEQMEAARDAFARHGIDFRFPWECDLDDLERERYDALREALEAAMNAQTN